MQEASAGQETQNAAGDAALRQLFVEYRLLNTLELFQRMGIREIADLEYVDESLIEELKLSRVDKSKVNTICMYICQRVGGRVGWRLGGLVWMGEWVVGGLCVCASVFIYVYINICVCVCDVCICIYIYICVYIYTYTYVNKYIHI